MRIEVRKRLIAAETYVQVKQKY